MSKSVVFMGVAGCGKSTIAGKVAQALSVHLIEGDDHHSASNREKMSQGVPLTDEDRDAWLGSLGDILSSSPQGVFLTCSALKRKYRDSLRSASPGLGFVFLEISQEAAQQRVAARSSHFFTASLVQSQFDALEPPLHEPDVLRADATLALDELAEQILAWLQTFSYKR
jgi:gluconokinase